MNPVNILIRPILTEKANKMTEKGSVYVFRVDRKANKLEIKNAIEKFYGVSVSEVNTMVVSSKKKVKFTKSGVLEGRKSAYKKAMVKLAEGETIDLYANI
ncbi:MAG: 50S ribosomal protein L23 [Chitinophagaceae bacterium]